jgi:hypothetical protein
MFPYTIDKMASVALEDGEIPTNSRYFDSVASPKNCDFCKTATHEVSNCKTICRNFRCLTHPFHAKSSCSKYCDDGFLVWTSTIKKYMNSKSDYSIVEDGVVILSTNSKLEGNNCEIISRKRKLNQLDDEAEIINLKKENNTLYYDLKDTERELDDLKRELNEIKNKLYAERLINERNEILLERVRNMVNEK